ncbi:MAG: hypothetical protein ACE5JZ_00270 [Kiloniellales bacterium]
MTQSKPDRQLCLMLAAAVGLVPSDALAYIDIGTTGMLLQLLVASVAGALVVVKMTWRRMRDATVRMIRGAGKQAETDPGHPAADRSHTERQ